MGDWIKHSPSWQGITQHWARLAGNVCRLRVPRAIDQHNRLIKNILVLVDDVALSHHLHSGAGFKASIWRDLLTLAEYVGQARAVGTALAAKGRTLDEAAFSQGRRDLQRLDQQILATLDAPHCRSALDDAILQSILDFLTYIDNQLLAEGPLVSVAEFYKVATSTLDQLYERFDQELTRINRRGA